MDELLIVNAAQCRPLREAILRPGQPPAAYTYPTDDDPQALHFAVKTEAGAVQGVATVLPEARTDGGREVWRLRGMAVLPERRGQGLGRMLLQAVQAVVQQRGGGLWCTARTSVEAFYLAHGFLRQGDVFELPGGGPHVLMSWNGVGKRLKPLARRGAPGAPKGGKAGVRAALAGKADAEEDEAPEDPDFEPDNPQEVPEGDPLDDELELPDDEPGDAPDPDEP